MTKSGEKIWKYPRKPFTLKEYTCRGDREGRRQRKGGRLDMSKERKVKRSNASETYNL